VGSTLSTAPPTRLATAVQLQPRPARSGPLAAPAAIAVPNSPATGAAPAGRRAGRSSRQRHRRRPPRPRSQPQPRPQPLVHPRPDRQRAAERAALVHGPAAPRHVRRRSRRRRRQRGRDHRRRAGGRAGRAPRLPRQRARLPGLRDPRRARLRGRDQERCDQPQPGRVAAAARLRRRERHLRQRSRRRQGNRRQDATRALNYAHERGATIVAGTANEPRDLDADRDGVQVFVQLPHMIAVSANGPRGCGSDPTTDLDLPACYSNYGQSVVE
jgi:hypothetical protein